MIAIRQEIDGDRPGEYDRPDNPLKHAPHTARMLLAADWTHGYAREQAAFPLPGAAGQVLATGEAARQRLRRPQPGLHLRAAGGFRGLSKCAYRRGAQALRCQPVIWRESQ